MLPKNQTPRPNGGPQRNWRLWRLVIAWAIALTLAVIILMVFRQQMVSADGGDASEAGTYSTSLATEIPGVATCAPRGPTLYDGLNTGAVRPTGPDNEGEAESIVSKGCGTSRVWVATLTVGGASDSNVSYLGFAPPLDPEGGALDDTEFSHGGVDYTVETLFYQVVSGGVEQLVFDAGAPLSDKLVLQVGHRQFFVSDSLKLGTDGDIHAWRLNRSLNWTVGQSVGLQIRAMR